VFSVKCTGSFGTKHGAGFLERVFCAAHNPEHIFLLPLTSHDSLTVKYARSALWCRFYPLDISSLL
jgi:hypothetical protein